MLFNSRLWIPKGLSNSNGKLFELNASVSANDFIDARSALIRMRTIRLEHRFPNVYGLPPPILEKKPNALMIK